MGVEYGQNRLFRSNEQFVFIGADETNRTSDLLITNQLLYRLSYISKPAQIICASLRQGNYKAASNFKILSETRRVINFNARHMSDMLARNFFRNAAVGIQRSCCVG